MASHFFDVEIAKEYGLVESILFQNIAYWVEKNRANGENFFDGTFWTYNSIKAFEQLFPYLTGKKIRGALARLVDAGLIITGNYNKSTYDRTLWYGLTEKGICIFQKDNLHFTKRANGDSPKGEPIPDINTDIKPDNNNPPLPPVGASEASGKKAKKPTNAQELKDLFASLSDGMRKAMEDFAEMRKSVKKPMTPRAAKLILDKLQKLYGEDEQGKIASIEQSIMHGWQGVFEVKDDGRTQARPSYAPNANGKSRYIRESEQNFDNLPMTEDGFLDWSKV